MKAPEFTRLYFEKYALMNWMFPAASFIDEGVVATVTDVMPRAEFVENALEQGVDEAAGHRGCNCSQS